MNALMELIAAADAEARPHFACEDGDHFWHLEGGRCCPMGAEGCSQAVYACKVCGVYDYGDGDDSPGKRDCQALCGDSMMGWRNGHLDPSPDYGVREGGPNVGIEPHLPAQEER